MGDMYFTQANQQSSEYLSNQHSTTICLKKRRAAFSPNKPTSVHSLPSPVGGYHIHTATSRRIRHPVRPSGTPADLPGSTSHEQIPINLSRQILREQSASLPNSGSSSSSTSGSFRFLNPDSPVYQTPFNESDLGTPVLTFSGHSTSLPGSDLSPPDASGLFHRHYPPDTQSTGAQLERWLDFNIDGTVAELCDEPTQDESYEGFAAVGQEGTQPAPKCGMPGLGKTPLHFTNVAEPHSTSQSAQSHPFDQTVSGQPYTLVCDCHGLPYHSPLPQRGAEQQNTVYALYTSQISSNRDPLPRRVQDTFDATYEAVRKYINRLEPRIQMMVDLLFGTTPTLHDGLTTLVTLHGGDTPLTLHGLVSLALLTKSVLLLQDHNTPLNVHDILLLDQMSYVNFIQQDFDKQSYAIFIQLLWPSSSVEHFNLEGQRLFCPKAYLARLSPGWPVMTISGFPTFWHSARICDGLVDGKTENPFSSIQLTELSNSQGCLLPCPITLTYFYRLPIRQCAPSIQRIHYSPPNRILGKGRLGYFGEDSIQGFHRGSAGGTPE
jgi:hypothetical protein